MKIFANLDLRLRQAAFLSFSFVLLNVITTFAEESKRPPQSEAETAIKKLVTQQSGGRIELVGDFANFGESHSVYEIFGKKVYPYVFSTKVVAKEPCKWAYNYPLVFKTFRIDDTNAPPDSEAMKIPAAGEVIIVRGVAFFSFSNAWEVVGFARPIELKRNADELSDLCVIHLGQLGIALKTWAYKHNNQYPFNLSTNLGGTKELSRFASTGLDSNSYIHFLCLSNTIEYPYYLKCPADKTKKTAQKYKELLSGDNVSYLLYTGTNVDEFHPESVLARCPIHGHTLYCDGHVERGDKK